MKSFFKYCSLLFILSLSHFVYAQRVVLHDSDMSKKGIVYKEEWSAEIALHHNGFYFGYNKAKIHSFRKTNFFHVDIGYINDGRAVSQNKNFVEVGLSNSFSYGKQNLFFQIRVAKGVKHYLSEKYTKKGLALAYTYRIGPSFGLLKPVYIEVFEFEGDKVKLESIKYTEENHDRFMRYDRIYGGSSFWKGWSKLRIVPGIHANLAFHFAMGAYGKYVRAMELGIMGDLYIKKIPLMVETEFINNKPFFLKLYVNLQMGTRNN